MFYFMVWSRRGSTPLGDIKLGEKSPWGVLPRRDDRYIGLYKLLPCLLLTLLIAVPMRAQMPDTTGIYGERKQILTM